MIINNYSCFSISHSPTHCETLVVYNISFTMNVNKISMLFTRLWKLFSAKPAIRKTLRCSKDTLYISGKPLPKKNSH